MIIGIKKFKIICEKILDLYPQIVYWFPILLNALQNHYNIYILRFFNPQILL